jgi:energy-converting hydrogenase Eha subunit A
MEYAAVWKAKTDDEVVAAADDLEAFPERDEKVAIRNEFHRRGLHRPLAERSRIGMPQLIIVTLLALQEIIVLALNLGAPLLPMDPPPPEEWLPSIEFGTRVLSALPIFGLLLGIFVIHLRYRLGRFLTPLRRTALVICLLCLFFVSFGFLRSQMGVSAVEAQGPPLSVLWPILTFALLAFVLFNREAARGAHRAGEDQATDHEEEKEEVPGRKGDLDRN